MCVFCTGSKRIKVNREQPRELGTDSTAVVSKSSYVCHFPKDIKTGFLKDRTERKKKPCDLNF